MKTTGDRLKQLDAVYQECRKLFEKKNIDYSDSFSRAGAVGVLIRLGDKLDRCKNITKTSITLVHDEKLRDTLLDIANYAKMAVFLLDEKEEIECTLISSKDNVNWQAGDIDLWSSQKKVD